MQKRSDWLSADGHIKLSGFSDRSMVVFLVFFFPLSQHGKSGQVLRPLLCYWLCCFPPFHTT